MKIAVLGYGNVGKKLSSLFDRAAHEIIIGLRSTSERTANYYSTDFEEAARLADVIILAIPFTACASALPAIAKAASGKIVLDVTNPINPDWSPLLLGVENSAGEEINRLLPKAHVVKAFNTIFADIMNKPMDQGLAVTAFIAGNSKSAKQTVATMASDVGYHPIDVGPIYVARYLENMAHLNIQIAVGQQQGTDAAFVYLRS